MSGIFLKLLNLSISASWLVLVVLALRLVLKRAPKWVNVLLWGMVALRLMLPFSIESALSLIPSAETLSPEVVQFDPAPTITSGVELIDNAVNPSLSESFAAAPLASVNPLYVWTYLAGWVWLIGLAAMLAYALVSYLRLRRRVSASIPLRENIYVCDEVPSPFILGIVHPRIYLPSALDEAQRGSGSRMSARTSRGVTTGGSRWAMPCWRSTGSTRCCGLPIPCSAATSSWPATSACCAAWTRGRSRTIRARCSRAACRGVCLPPVRSPSARWAWVRA